MTSDSTNSESCDAVAASLLQALRGSPEGLGQALELCRLYLLEVANAELDTCLRAKAGASDLVQETFLEAQRIIDRFQGGSTGELQAWLRAILLNKLGTLTRQYLGTAKRALGKEVDFTTEDGVPRDIASPTPTPSSLVRRDERETIVSAALERLPENYRQVIVWRQMENLSFEDMAARLERSVDAVRKLWFRALRQLQQELGSAL